MNDFEIIGLTPENIADYGVCGYKDGNKHKELRNKIAWFKEYYPKGLRIKIVLVKNGGYQGMIEYIPGSLAHRPVDAKNYLFIHCVFVGFKNEFKGKGLATRLIDECIKDAKAGNMEGVAVVTRKGSFMVDKDIFVKKGFQEVDHAEPDFCLLALKFNDESESPRFKASLKELPDDYKSGLTIIRSPQCPYTEKNVSAIMQSAVTKFNIKARLVDVKDAGTAQKTPCAFGTFCMIYNGKVISHHPVSNTRFENIMNDIIKKQKK